MDEPRQPSWASSDPREYLGSSLLIDVDHPTIRTCARELGSAARTEEETTCTTFEFVRDQISHSWDIQSRRVTARASEVLERCEGICYAKSHLFAALLRAQGIPAGICYQRLTFDAFADSGFCVHALNTVYLSRLGRWIRLDARGNKPGVDAQFSVDHEQLAFPVRPEIGECDYWTNYIEPHPMVVRTLLSHDDCRVMYADCLPTEL
jgi:transglutaminase-like putative cysteine protease